MNEPTLFVLTIVGWLLAGFAAIGVKVLREFSRHELEAYARRRRNLARFGDILDHHEDVGMAVESLQVIGMIIGVLAGAWWLARLGDEVATDFDLLLAFIVALVCLLVATVWIPWAVVQFWSAPFLYRTWRIWVFISRLLYPLSLGSKLAGAIASRLAGSSEEEFTEEEAFEEEIRAIVTEGLHEGHLEPDAREMIESVIELADADVADIMTPRSHVDAVNVAADWQEIVSFVVSCERTRIPVYEGTLDRVVGILYAKDLLPELAKPVSEQRRTLPEIVRDPWFVPSTKRVDELLREFLRTHNHLAIVVDEYQAVAGVVTIEDVLEEIVGEIADEYDEGEVAPIVSLGEQQIEALGHVHVEDVNEFLGIQLPADEDYDSIGGLVLARLGHIPLRGEQLEIDGVRISVEEASRRSVDKVRIEVLQDARAARP